MNSHEEILKRMNEANPLPDVEMITDGQLAEMTLQVEKARRAGTDTDRPAELAPVRPRIRWWRPAAVFAAALVAAFVVIGAVSLVTGGESDVADEPTTSTTVSASSTTAPLPPGEWNPILATTVAGIAPEPAACPAGTDPNRPGPAWQERPATAQAEHAGAFDRRTGRIMYVDGEGETWAFDVCSNTWHNLEPVGTPLYQSLVYDIDSDVTIALGPGQISVYDAAANEWTRPTLEIVGDSPPRRFWGVAYDPVSGLVIATTDQQQVWALDVDAPSLTMISAEPLGVDLAGYVESIDRLVGLAVGQTYLINPRNGETTFAGSGEVPESGWGRFGFFAADGTVFIGSVGIDGRGAGCGFNTETLAWDRCYEGLSPPIESFVSRVEDSINGRVVLIHHYNVVHESVADVSSGVVDDVWALDLDTGEWTEVVEPTSVGPVTIEDASDAPQDTIDTAQPGQWNSILADTRAGPLPPAATCPPDSSPDEPGPISQERPQLGFNGMLAAAFDHRLGQIIFADTNGQTWGFDVCTNTWNDLNPSGTPPAESSSGWVYDVDSDRTIAIGSLIGVYDAETNEWSTAVGNGKGYPFGAVYDPVSGLVITTILDEDGLGMELWAYDGDTDTWTLVGHIAQQGDLLGYTPELDRLIIATRDNRTALVDPRSGEATLVSTETPAVHFGWPKASYGTTFDTAFVAYGVKAAGGAMFVDVFPGLICGFDAATLTWNSCFASPGEGDYQGFGAIVGDPINNRLVVINGIYGSFWVNATDHIWAIDLETGELNELLEPSE